MTDFDLTDIVILDLPPAQEFDDQPTQPIPAETMAQLVGMAPIGPDRPTRDLRALSDGVPWPVNEVAAWRFRGRTRDLRGA